MTSFNPDISANGKLSSTSKEFRALFLLLFTKELIKHSKVSEVSRLETIIKRKILPPKKDVFEQFIDKDEMMPSIMSSEPMMPRRMPKPPLVFPSNPIKAPLSPFQNFQSQQIANKYFPKRLERIPESQLPPQLQYIKPVPTDVQIDLGKLNSLIQNPEVMSLECNGPEEPLNAKGSKGAKILNMTLTKEEISKIIQNFSDATKIPIHEGIFKVAAGNMIISAIVSDVIGSRFIIRKMQPQQNQMMWRY